MSFITTFKEDTTLRWNWLDKNAKTLVFLLTIIGFALRVYRVDFLSIWGDENIYISKILLFFSGGNLFEGENHGLIHLLLTIPLVKIFNTNELWFRMPSVLFGTFSIPFIYLLAKRLFNTHIALFAAILNTFSLYNIFWARVVRNYSSFELFYLLLLLAFLAFYEPNKINTIKNFFAKYNISLKYLLLFLLALIVSVLNHELSLFIAFSIGVYCSIIGFYYMFQKQREDRWINKYTFVLYPFILFMLFLFSPLLGNITRELFLLSFPESVVNFITPDWDRIISFLKDPEKRFITFNIYTGVLKSDYVYLYILGLLGFVLSFFINKKSAVFLGSFFIVPFLLMSFVFREPSLPRYLIYIYQLFLIAISVSIYFVLKLLIAMINNTKVQLPFSKGVLNFILLAITLISLSFAVPKEEIKSLITTKTHGRVIKNELSNWVFTNWKQPCKYIKQYLKEDDVVFSTNYGPTAFYLNKKEEDVHWFRQVHYNTTAKKYELDAYDTSGTVSARTFENFLEAYRTHQRGWIITDYYFYNVMTDQRVRDFVIRNCKYHFTFSKEGDIQVFSWDHSNPEPQKSILAEVGKGNKLASPEFNITLNGIHNAQSAYFILDCEGIDNNMEAILVVNKKHSIYIPQSNSLYRTNVTMQVDKSWLSENNTIQFGYNKDTKDVLDGFVIYNVNVQLR